MRNDFLTMLANPIPAAALVMCAGVAAIACAPSASPQDDLAKALERIKDSAADIKDLRADFRQVRHTPLLRKPLESSGTISMNADLLLWETEASQPSTMAISEGEVRILYPEDKLLEIYEMKEEMGPVATSPLVRFEELETSFTFELIDESQADQDELETQPSAQESDQEEVELISLRLTPRSEPLSMHLESITLHIAKQDGLVRSAVILNPDGERTEIVFENITLNEGGELIDITRNPPEGTTISRPGRRDDDAAMERTR